MSSKSEETAYSMVHLYESQYSGSHRKGSVKDSEVLDLGVKVNDARHSVAFTRDQPIAAANAEESKLIYENKSEHQERIQSLLSSNRQLREQLVRVESLQRGSVKMQVVDGLQCKVRELESVQGVIRDKLVGIGIPQSKIGEWMKLGLQKSVHGDPARHDLGTKDRKKITKFQSSSGVRAAVPLTKDNQQQYEQQGRLEAQSVVQEQRILEQDRLLESHQTLLANALRQAREVVLLNEEQEVVHAEYNDCKVHQERTEQRLLASEQTLASKHASVEHLQSYIDAQTSHTRPSAEIRREVVKDTEASNLLKVSESVNATLEQHLQSLREKLVQSDIALQQSQDNVEVVRAEYRDKIQLLEQDLASQERVFFDKLRVVQEQQRAQEDIIRSEEQQYAGRARAAAEKEALGLRERVQASERARERIVLEAADAEARASQAEKQVYELRESLLSTESQQMASETRLEECLKEVEWRRHQMEVDQSRRQQQQRKEASERVTVRASIRDREQPETPGRSRKDTPLSTSNSSNSNSATIRSKPQASYSRNMDSGISKQGSISKVVSQKQPIVKPVLPSPSNVIVASPSSVSQRVSAPSTVTTPVVAKPIVAKPAIVATPNETKPIIQAAVQQQQQQQQQLPPPTPSIQTQQHTLAPPIPAASNNTEIEDLMNMSLSDISSLDMSGLDDF